MLELIKVLIIWALFFNRKHPAASTKNILNNNQAGCWSKQMKYKKSTVDLLVTNKEFGPIIRKYTEGKKKKR